MQMGSYRPLIAGLLVIVCFSASVIAPASIRAAQASAAQPRPEATSPVDILVQGAVDSELQPLLEALEERQEIQFSSWTFWRGKISGKRVVVSRTEVGPINAAAATTLAILTFRPRLIINQGTAGAHDPQLRVYDIIVGQLAIDYGAFRSTHAGAGEGIEMSRWSPLYHRLRLDGKQRVEFKGFPGDEAAMRVALGTKYARGRVLKGVIGSAFEYNRELDRLGWVRETYDTSSEDMESAFAAGVARGFNTPFLAIRIISDSEFYAPELQPAAGQYCAAFVLDVIKKI